MSNHTIKDVLNELIKGNMTLILPELVLITCFLRKMVLVKTRYKTYDDKFPAIYKAFKT